MTAKQEEILIVDDEQSIRKLLQQILSKEGYRCEEAANSEEALEKLRSNAISLVFLDIKMPGKSGIDLLPEIKMGYPDTAIIMDTAIIEIGAAIQCMKNGADDYICKPFNVGEVSLVVQRVLEKRYLKLQIREYRQHLEEKVEEQTGEIRRIFLGAMEALVFALEAKDRYTGGHSRRVTSVALALGEELVLSSDDMDDLRWGSLLHDVGKIAVDHLIQNKPGKLTNEEYEHIMIHPYVGAGIVQPVVNERVVEIIKHHHDRYDGSGLHQSVAGRDIPLAARILAVADSYDAMTSDRPYRPAMTRENALDEIKSCMTTQFDPVVAETFLKIMNQKSKSFDFARTRI